MPGGPWKSGHLFRKRHMNDNFNSETTKAAIVKALTFETGLTSAAAEKVVNFMTAEGIIDFPVAAELYEERPGF